MHGNGLFRFGFIRLTNPVYRPSGIIGARIYAHKADPTITRHRTKGTLYVTWAEVPEALIERVEKYLADMYRPIEGDRYPDVVPLAVNLPGA